MVRLRYIWKEIISPSILSGLYISLAGLGYLVLGGVLGAVLFGAGLLGIIATGGSLYTGRIYEERNLGILGLVLLGNVLGCAVGGVLSALSYPDIIQTSSSVISARATASWVAVLWRSVGCGMLMTSAVLGMKARNPWPLLLGIPLFVLSGLYHSVADAFYFFVAPDLRYLLVWPLVVLGNWIGGKILWIKR